MNATTRRRLIEQGFTDLGSASFEEIAPWLRLAPALCSLVTLVGTATGNYLVLWSLAPAGIIAATTSKHPLDRLYDWIIRPILGRTRRLPPYQAPRRFSAGLAATQLFATGVLFLLGFRLAGLVLGLLLALPLGLAAITDICTGCVMYHRLRKARRQAALLGVLAMLPFGGSHEVLAQADSDAQRPTSYAPRPVFTGSSFVVARYKHGSTASLYLSQRFGAGMIVAGGVANPDGTYRAMVVGPGTRIRLGEHAAATLVLAGAKATDGGSLRLYAIPRLTAGPVNITAFGGAYQHVSGTNHTQASLDPLTASVPVLGILRLGVAGVVVAKTARLPDFGVGPAAQIRLPGGTLAVEMVSYTQPARREWRGTFNATR